MPGKNLRVYAVWFNMFPGDSEAKWPAELLTDSRIEHFWDSEKSVGTWFGENVTAKAPGHVEWDAYLLYAGDSEWAAVPSGLISWGRTIVASRQQLRSDLLGLVHPQP